jgi:hypothetical protein
MGKTEEKTTVSDFLIVVFSLDAGPVRIGWVKRKKRPRSENH